MKDFGLLFVQIFWVASVSAMLYYALIALDAKNNAKLIRLAAIFICLGLFTDMIQWIADGVTRIGDKLDKIIQLL